MSRPLIRFHTRIGRDRSRDYPHSEWTTQVNSVGYLSPTRDHLSSACWVTDDGGAGVRGFGEHQARGSVATHAAVQS
jgi:hypothetical protein